MKVYDQAYLYRVTVDEHDIDSFRRRWPGSGMRSGDRASFTFEKRNDDLVDMTYNGRYPQPSRVDEGALSALAGDAQEYGAAKFDETDREVSQPVFKWRRVFKWRVKKPR